tara:strand:+ start:384 stop:695 length:312 start_codon:yes stop_codon:yes gene_type:complete
LRDKRVQRYKEVKKLQNKKITYSKKEQRVKLEILRSRVGKWKQIYMMDSDRDQVEKDLTIIENCIEGLERQRRASLASGLGYSVMKLMNEIWHRYNTKKKTTI